MTSFKKFETADARELFVTISPLGRGSFSSQADEIFCQIRQISLENDFTTRDIIFAKFFISDSCNQIKELRSNSSLNSMTCAISIIEQQPLDGAKINALFWLVKKEGLHKYIEGDAFIAEVEGLKHIFYTPSTIGNDSFCQTLHSFEKNERMLQKYGASTANNCVRTWLHVRDIDMNYQGVVKARNNFFDTIGLTKETHFIASTGIEGCMCQDIVSTDFYSVAGLSPEKVSYLSAPDYLNATHQYGVAFERGAIVDYSTQRHIFISGTASINNAGQCINIGDPEAQTHRILLIISKLLEKAQSKLDDTCLMIIYVRDASDYQCVAKIISEQCNNIPHVIVRAPVCRPQWLVEIECFAITAQA